MPVRKTTDHLYGLAREEFIAARANAVKDLRAKGHGEAADEIGKLPKPTVAAWALNQAQRSNRSGMDDLIAASRRVREAQAKLLAGGNRKPLDEAAREERRLAEEVVESARAALDSPSEATITKVRDTLSGLGLDEDLEAELGEGRLAKEREAAGGFGLDPGMKVAPSKASKDAAKGRKARAAEEKKLAKAEQALRDAEERLRDAEAALKDAKQTAARAEAEVGKATTARDKAEREVEKVRKAAG